jgi:5-methylcytosine-specific restriction endonuclease McrA
VNSQQSKPRRVRLDSEAYGRLCQEILKRDSFRCQSCGSMQNPQVDHKKYRSQSGKDSEQNLITLCAPCHRAVHKQT